MDGRQPDLAFWELRTTVRMNSRLRVGGRDGHLLPLAVSEHCDLGNAFSYSFILFTCDGVSLCSLGCPGTLSAFLYLLPSTDVHHCTQWRLCMHCGAVELPVHEVRCCRSSPGPAEGLGDPWRASALKPTLGGGRSRLRGQKN